MNVPIDLVSGAVSTNIGVRQYIADVTTDTTITVPTSSTDGTNPSFSRQVAAGSSLVTLQSSTNDIRVNPSTAVTDFVLFPSNNVEFISYNNQYLVGRSAKNASVGILPKFSGTSTLENLYITEVDTQFVLSIINMATRSQPNTMTVCLTNINIPDPVTGSIVLATDDTLTTLIMEVPVSMDSSSTTDVLTTDILLDSTAFETNYYLGWIRTSSNASLSIRLDSIVIT